MSLYSSTEELGQEDHCRLEATLGYIVNSNCLRFTRRPCLTNKRDRERAQQAKTLAAELNDLGSVPGTHAMAEENCLPQVVP